MYTSRYKDYETALELIETLWNVNVAKHRGGSNVAQGINRNIVECK